MSKRVLITGGAGGIGTAATEELRRRGALVIGLDLNADGLDDIAGITPHQVEVNLQQPDGTFAQAFELTGLSHAVGVTASASWPAPAGTWTPR